MAGKGRALVAGVALVLAALAVGVALLVRQDRAALREGPATLRVSEALSTASRDGGLPEGYARATEVRPFHFPEDHGPHPAFRTEWWYWTGNLEGEGGRRFGYQLTLFRTALAPDAPRRTSGWAAREVYMGHLAVSDVGGRTFHAFERFSRAAQGLAGADGAPFRVWLEDWSVKSTGEGFAPLRLVAGQAGVALDLTLEEGKAPVLQGDRGLSQKGPETGNASYYYSLTRMPTRGTVRVGDDTFTVSGNSWMDREWSTSALSSGQVGWDWFSLQLGESSELMYYQLRRNDGTADPLSAGTLVRQDGTVKRLSRDDVRLSVTGRWASERTGTRYPAGWTLEVPGEGVRLTVRPALADQELRVSVHYWEGAVDVEGTRGGQRVKGRGYVELTGYGDEASARR